MARSANNLNAVLQDTADAIKAKKGTSAKICPRDFADEIAGIQIGIIPVGTKYITENGNNIDVTQYAAVNVSVSGGGSSAQYDDWWGSTMFFNGIYTNSGITYATVQLSNHAFTANESIELTDDSSVSFDIDGDVTICLPIIMPSDNAYRELDVQDANGYNYSPDGGDFDPRFIDNISGTSLSGNLIIKDAAGTTLISIPLSDVVDNSSDS